MKESLEPKFGWKNQRIKLDGAKYSITERLAFARETIYCFALVNEGRER